MGERLWLFLSLSFSFFYLTGQDERYQNSYVIAMKSCRYRRTLPSSTAYKFAKLPAFDL